MDNYKIKVKDEAESKEVISLLIQLGYKDSESDRFGFVYTIGEKIGCDFLKHWEYYSSQGCKELTLPQLRDLVVLKRNDVKDATHVDPGGTKHIELDGRWYWFHEESTPDIQFGWVKSASYREYDDKVLKPIKQPQDPALISGADALRALADGKSVEWEDENGAWWSVGAAWTWNQLLNMSGIKSLRLKPQTIKLELELPNPFDPNEGDEYFYISTLQHCLYSHDVWSDEPADITQAAFGAYRTEDDVKKAVEQLRKIRGTNS
ncbi:hypothetical protein [Acinetobacter calcoaceticus]